MATKRNLIVLAAALTSGAAFGADATFENHLQSTPIVSPAQLYQVGNTKTDFSLGYASSKDSTKADAGKTTDTTTGTELFAAGIYNIHAIGLRAGLSADYTTGAYENKTVAGDKFEGDVTMTNVTPQAAYPIGPVVVGAALDITQISLKPDEGEEAKASYTTFRPGVLFQDSKLEAGVAYTSPHNAPSEEVDELSVISPAVVALHGRYALDSALAVGAIVANKNHKAIDDETMKDQTTLTATTEYTAGVIKVEGDVAYNSAYYKNKESIDSTNISTIGIGAAADYAVNQDATVGGAINYEFGSDKANGTEYAVNDLGFAIRGNVRF